MYSGSLKSITLIYFNGCRLSSVVRSADYIATSSNGRYFKSLIII